MKNFLFFLYSQKYLERFITLTYYLIMEQIEKLKPSDSKSPIQFLPEQIAILQTVYEIFSRLASKTLSMQLRTMVVVHLDSITQTNYKKFVQSIPNSTTLVMFGIESISESAILEFSPSIVFTMTDRLFGGKGKSPIFDRKISDIEMSAIETITIKLLENMADSWSIKDLNFKSKNIETSSQFAQIISSNEDIIFISFQIKINEITGNLNICIPYVLIESIFSNYEKKIDMVKQKSNLTISIEEYQVLVKTDIEKFVEIIKAILRMDKRFNIGILVLALEEETAVTVLQHLLDFEIEQIILDISKFNIISQSDVRYALENYFNILSTFSFVGGIERARVLTEKAIGTEKATEILNELASSISKEEVPFNFINKTDPFYLLKFVQNEHTQTIAMILSHLDPSKASAILSTLSLAIQADVIKRIATMDRIDLDILKAVEIVLEKKLSSIDSMYYSSAGGIDFVIGILNNSGRSTVKIIIEALEENDPEFAEEIKKRIFVFEDIVLLDDRAVQKVFREIDNQDLAKALKSVDNEVQEKIFKNLSKRAGQLLKEEMDFIGPIRLKDVEDAQQKIVNIIRKLEEIGEIILISGDKDELVV